MACGCNENGCPAKFVRADDPIASMAKLFNDGKCFKDGDGALNIFSAIMQVKQSIDNYADTVKEKGYASALIHFRSSVVNKAVTNGVIYNDEFSRSPFNYKVTGFGASCLAIAPSGGTYNNDDQFEIRLYDFTANKQIGESLYLSPIQLHDKHTDLGMPIGDNIAPGHIYGLKVRYINTDAGAMTGPLIDAYIHVEPVELVTET